MLTITQAFPENKHKLWHVVDYLQRDAAAKGLLKNPTESFGSFWNNLDTIMENKSKLYVASNSRDSLVGYMVLFDRQDGTLSLDIFEVLPRYRNKGFGKEMVEWLRQKALASGFHSIKIIPANHSENFWKGLGFSDWGMGGLLLPIA